MPNRIYCRTIEDEAIIDRLRVRYPNLQITLMNYNCSYYSTNRTKTPVCQQARYTTPSRDRHRPGRQEDPIDNKDLERSE
jgi:hypothetical protein